MAWRRTGAIPPKDQRNDLSRTPPSRIPRWLRFAVFTLFGYLVVVVMLTFLQRSLIYHPSRAAHIEPQDADLPAAQVDDLSVSTADGLLLHGWHVLPYQERNHSRTDCDRALTGGRFLFLYFPGNAGHRGYRGAELTILTNLGANVFLFDYRGYGDNGGSPTQQRLFEDAHAIWDYATQQRHVAHDRIVLYGESLGGGVAVRLANELSQAGTPPGGIVLRSTFPSLVEAAAYHYPWLPVRWALVDRFPSNEYLPQVTCPILQIHGSDDWIVPLRLARRLFDAAPEKSRCGIPKHFAELPAVGHNDVPYAAQAELGRTVEQFLARLSLRAR